MNGTPERAVPDGSLRVVYVTSMGHSGSTLLDLLLSAHSRVTSVGEINKLVSRDEPGCSCDHKRVWECPFWGEVEVAFRRRTGEALRAARILSGNDREHAAHNRALFEAVSEVTGKSIIVDSSKSLHRLRRLLETAAIEVLPIHLVRGSQGVVYSNLKKGRRWLRVSFLHGMRVGYTERFLAGRPHVSLDYERLVAAPQESLETIMPAIGLPFEPRQLRWGEPVRHNCEGNRMRRSRDSTIRPDLAWQAAMPGWQKAAVEALARAGRVSARLA